jgi:stage III sporulation protein AG
LFKEENMKKLTDNKNISALLNNDKAVKIIVAVGFAIILIIMFSDLFGTGTNTGNETGNNTPSIEFRQDADRYARQLEEQLIEILSQIKGVGSVSVMLTLENYDDKGMPRVRGAAVVCEGGGDIHVKQKVVETVSKVLGISTARVSVVY